MPAAEPLFLPGSAGQLFALYVPAAEGLIRGPAPRGVLLLPPFAEEMNRSRRMLRLQAAALAQHGFAALLLDPFGTGDSSGDFADARWETWVADVRLAAEALMARGVTEIGLLGLRLGALLAAAAVPLLRACFATVLWQAVVSGRSYLDEVLRLRTLPGALNDRAPMTINGMRGSLEAGVPIEVAGYEIGPALAHAIDALDLERMADPAAGPVTWLELVRDPALPLSRAGGRCAEAWRAQGVQVETQTVTGPAFWTGQGNALCPALVDATIAAFERAR